MTDEPKWLSDAELVARIDQEDSNYCFIGYRVARACVALGDAPRDLAVMRERAAQ